MKSIKTKLSVYFGVLIIFVCLALGTIAYYSSNFASSEVALSAEVLNDVMKEMIEHVNKFKI